ncbi:hypothetical protein KKH43_01255 [Patescibacteria group bacterium]|nr:hypothetical protein [Patescibacteria group bacterium]
MEKVIIGASIFYYWTHFSNDLLREVLISCGGDKALIFLGEVTDVRLVHLLQWGYLSRKGKTWEVVVKGETTWNERDQFASFLQIWTSGYEVNFCGMPYESLGTISKEVHEEVHGADIACEQAIFLIPPETYYASGETTIQFE